MALADDAFEHLVEVAGGDARQALNILEGAVALAEAEEARSPDGAVAPTLAHVEGAAQQRVLAYDRAGDGHYDTVSAFIKSIRGNDPDGALYWLAAMVAAGEDPRFIARRLIISASEDVGNADPRGLSIAVAAAQALDHVGLPEAQYALAQATAYLATAPKSNRAGAAYWAAANDVVARGSLPVPMHLRNAPDRRMKSHGIGVGYRFPHDFDGRGRRPAVPARHARRAPLLQAHGPGLRGDDRPADGQPRGGSRGGARAWPDAQEPVPGARCRLDGRVRRRSREPARRTARSSPTPQKGDAGA